MTTLKEAPSPLSAEDQLEKRLYTAIIEAGNSVMKPRVLKDLNT
jgi:hypothetical protein